MNIFVFQSSFVLFITCLFSKNFLLNIMVVHNRKRIIILCPTRMEVAQKFSTSGRPLVIRYKAWLV